MLIYAHEKRLPRSGLVQVLMWEVTSSPVMSHMPFLAN